MTQKTINLGTADQGNGDPIRVAFGKVNDNFTELYTALGLNVGGLNLGAFEFTGSTMTTTDSSAIVIDQSVSVTSDLTVSGDVVPNIANGGDLGSLARPWKTLYVSNQTIYLGSVPLSLDANNNLTVNGNQVTGDGNSFDQDLNTDDSVTFNSVGATTVNVSQINGTNPGDELVIQANNNNWNFGTDGALTLPNGSTIGDGDAVFGVPITTTRGSILIGNQAECQGGENHFHIMKAGQQDIDLFLGDDNNYVKLPSTGGVEISSSEIGAQHYWTFGADGKLNLPEGGDILNSNGDSVLGGGSSTVVRQDTPPSADNGTLWFNTLEGRLYIKYSDAWIDAAPLMTPAPDTDIDVASITFPDASVQTTAFTGSASTDRLVNGDNELVLESNGNLTIPGDITGNNDINITVDSGDSSSHTWNFGEDGNLTAPGDITTGLDGLGGRFIQDCADGTTSMRWINVNQGDDTTQLIRAYTGDPKLNTEVERAQIKLNWDQTEDKSGLTIRTFDQTDPNNEVDHDWLFKGDGVLQLPVGGDIVDSEGNSVLGSVDNNIWVQTFETASPATDVPQVAVSVEYDSDGNIIALFSHVNPVDDSTYYSVGKYTTTGTRIWTTGFADDFNTDGWGLAVDNAGGFVYIAGDTNTDGGEDNATLTKIDGATGLVEWSKIYDFGFSSFSSVVDVTSDGDPVMVGFASNGDDRYVATTKVDQTDGSVIWSRALDGQNDEEAYGMAVGPSGEVVAVGYMESFGVQDAAETLSVDPVSDPQWTTSGSISADGVTADFTFTDGIPTFTNVVDTVGGRTADDVIVTVLGSTIGGVNGVDDMIVKVATVAANDTDDRMLVVKYAANGTIAWQKAIQFDENFDCSGADADIDSEGNIYVCGQYGDDNVDPIGQLMSIVKFNSSGVKQWSRRVVGNCGQWSSSIVVGADDHLYLSATTFSGTEEADLDIHLVLAKYGFDGTVAWQRLLDYTAGYSFGTNFFGSDIGGSNLAVKQDYVAVSLGFGGEGLFGGPGSVNAAIAQISATGDIFTVGSWDFKSASFSGVVNSTASDITVVDADKTDYDNIANISTTAVTLEEDSSDFLIGTLFTAPGGDNSLVNGAYTVTLENTGTLTLPAGGTITEGYVTSNPTIQLTPASPTVASQKLVIKGGGTYTYTDNGIEINYNNNTGIVGDTLTFTIYSTTYSGQTLYWWINPEGAGIGDTESGTVTITDNTGQINILIDSDDYEFTLRVSPEDHNYDPASLGVESGLINADAPTLDADHHLHLTTGDLTETSIFLGTDDHNVRTTVNGGIEITTPNGGVWQFGTDGNLTIPGNIRSEGNINIDINLSDSTLHRWSFGEDGSLTLPIGISIDDNVNPLYPKIIADSGKLFSVQGQGSTGSAALAWTVDPDAAGQYAAVAVFKDGGDNLAKVILQAQSDSGDAATAKLWKFDETGALTIPGDILSEGAINIDINLSDSTLRRWRFGEDGDLTFPDATVQTTAFVQGEQVFTLDTGAIDYAPTVVDFNLLFVTPAIGYSETDPTSVTLPNGAPGQRLVIFNGYNLATLTVNPGPFGRDISGGVVAEFIYSDFDGLWMPLYGTNSPT